MTIEEAILKYKEITNTNANCNISCDKCVQESEQLTEWLEELKSYQQQHIALCEKHDINRVEDLYVKAIDDFANACKEDILCQTFGLNINRIRYIAEKLKRGKL